MLWYRKHRRRRHTAFAWSPSGRRPIAELLLIRGRAGWRRHVTGRERTIRIWERLARCCLFGSLFVLAGAKHTRAHREECGPVLLPHSCHRLAHRVLRGIPRLPRRWSLPLHCCALCSRQPADNECPEGLERRLDEANSVCLGRCDRLVDRLGVGRIEWLNARLVQERRSLHEMSVLPLTGA